MLCKSLFSNIPHDLAEEAVETLLETGACRIERIVSLGHASPEGFWYDQPQAEWVLLVQGAARLTLEGQPPFEMLPGSYLHIPAHRRHRVEWTAPNEPTIWLAVHHGDQQ